MTGSGRHVWWLIPSYFEVFFVLLPVIDNNNGWMQGGNSAEIYCPLVPVTPHLGFICLGLGFSAQTLNNSVEQKKKAKS